jgi:hypothetical protein
MNQTTSSARPATSTPAPPRRAPAPRPAWQWPLLAIGAVLAVYLVWRGIDELFIIHYGDPASYAQDWGGPSLAGVLAVHSGPGLAIIVGAGWWLVRRARAVRRVVGRAAGEALRRSGPVS